MVENLSTVHQWVVIIGVACATYGTYLNIIRPLTAKRVWRAVLVPLWFIFYYGLMHFLIPLGTLLINFEFGQLAILLGATFVLVVIPFPINFALTSYIIGEKRAVLVIPIWSLAGWGITMILVLLAVAAIWSGWTLATGD